MQINLKTPSLCAQPLVLLWTLLRPRISSPCRRTIGKSERLTNGGLTSYDLGSAPLESGLRCYRVAIRDQGAIAVDNNYNILFSLNDEKSKMITHCSISWRLVKWRQPLDRFLLSMMLLPRIESDAKYRETGKNGKPEKFHSLTTS